MSTLFESMRENAGEHIEIVQREAREREVSRLDYMRHCEEQTEFDRALENEAWLEENRARLSKVLADEREFNRKNTKLYIDLEKKRDAGRALSIGKLSLDLVKEIFELSDEELRNL